MTDEKKKNQKIYIKFALILLVSLFIGFFLGIISNILKQMLPDMKNLSKLILSASVYMVPVLFVGMHITCAAIAFFQYNKCKKMMAAWDGEDDTTINEIEHKLNIPITLASICTVLNFAFFAILIHIANQDAVTRRTFIILDFLNIVIFILGYVWILSITHLTVNLEKQLNPEKKGNVFDTKFMKEWEESCDEAQKLIIYKAAFSAYKTGNSICSTLWIVGIILEFTVGNGLLPIIFTCIIWLGIQIAYTVTSIKLEG